MYVLIVLQLTDKSGVIVTDKKLTDAIIHNNSSSGISSGVPEHILFTHYVRPEGHFKNGYKLLTLRALKISMLYKYLTHTLKDVYFICRWRFKTS